jgi:hypothetical protein
MAVPPFSWGMIETFQQQNTVVGITIQYIIKSKKDEY